MDFGSSADRGKLGSLTSAAKHYGIAFWRAADNHVDAKKEFGVTRKKLIVVSVP